MIHVEIVSIFSLPLLPSLTSLMLRIPWTTRSPASTQLYVDGSVDRRLEQTLSIPVSLALILVE